MLAYFFIHITIIFTLIEIFNTFLLLYICIYLLYHISLFHTNKTSGMVSRTKAKGGEQTHGSTVCAMAVQ